jgi:hypothetical protein
MCFHKKDRSCFQAAFLGTLHLSGMVDKIAGMVDKIAGMVDKIAGMVDKIAGISVPLVHDDELLDNVDTGNRVDIHIEKDID